MQQQHSTGVYPRGKERHQAFLYSLKHHVLDLSHFHANEALSEQPFNKSEAGGGSLITRDRKNPSMSFKGNSENNFIGGD